MKQAFVYSFKVWILPILLFAFTDQCINIHRGYKKDWSLSSTYIETFTFTLPFFIVFFFAAWLTFRTTKSIAQKKTILTGLVVLLAIIASSIIMLWFKVGVSGWLDWPATFLIGMSMLIGNVWRYKVDPVVLNVEKKLIDAV